MAQRESQRLFRTISAAMEERFSEIGLDQLPPGTPVQMVWRVSDQETIESSAPWEATGTLNGYLSATRSDRESSLEDRVALAMGEVLEPLRDRYPLIGRTPTFHFWMFPQPDGSLLAVAVWRPLLQRVYWTVYALSIYTYLLYWGMAPLWVYLDARRRRMDAARWAWLASFANVVGVLAYLYVRRRSTVSSFSLSSSETQVAASFANTVRLSRAIRPRLIFTRFVARRRSVRRRVADSSEDDSDA